VLARCLGRCMVRSMECRCGCGQAAVPKTKKAFVDKEHQLEWMVAGGARELNALLPDEVRQRGGAVAGRAVAQSGQLAEAGRKGAARAAEIAAAWRARHKDSL